MRTQATKFNKVPVGGFFFMPELGEWLVKVSRRRGKIGSGWGEVYEPLQTGLVFILA